jgi:hypothetical protein
MKCINKKIEFLFLILTVFLVFSLTGVSAVAQGPACSDDYIVQADDWLSKVAERYFGDALAYFTGSSRNAY